jgi:hypothetical protein
MAQLAIEDPSLDPVTAAGRLYVPRNGTTPPPTQATQADPWADFPDAPPTAPKAQATAPATSAAPSVPISGPNNSHDPWAGFPDAAPTKEPSREVGHTEAGLRGVLHGISLGTAPALAGAAAAAHPDIEAAAKHFGIDPETAKAFIDAAIPFLPTLYGAGRLAYDKATAHPTLSGQVTGPQPTPAQAAYEAERSKEAKANEEASEQHPYLYTGSDIAGSMAVPIPGMGALKTGATLAPRIAAGIKAGAAGGGAFGAGNAIGEGRGAGEIASDAASGALEGGVFGGALHGAFGPRAVGAPTSADRAVQTAEDLGANLPKALSFDSRPAQAVGQLAIQAPLIGPRIATRAQKTLKAAEDKIGSMADELTPDASRAGTDTALKGPLDNAVEFNKRAQTGAYDTLRHEINPDQRVPLPHTLKALKEIEYRRMASGASRQQARAGLEEVWELATHPNGGGYNGVHMRRALLRNPPAALKLSNPGYEAGHFNHVAGEMTKDLHNIVRKTSINPNKAHKLFVEAEKNFGVLAEENKLLEKLRDANGEGGISKIINSAKEKGGFLQQLALVKKSLPPKDFERITGVIMSELGRNRAGDFTFAQFVTQWRLMSDAAKALLFRPEHKQWIDNIAQLAEHVKTADKLRNTSNTAGALILFDLLRSGVELGIGYGAGVVGGHEVGMAAGGLALGEMFGRYLASPARAASLSRWTQAYRAITLNQPTPARIAAFKVATRNLANTVDIPFDRIMSIAQDHAGGIPSSSAPNTQ